MANIQLLTYKIGSYLHESKKVAGLKISNNKWTRLYYCNIILWKDCDAASRLGMLLKLAPWTFCKTWFLKMGLFLKVISSIGLKLLVSLLIDKPATMCFFSNFFHSPLIETFIIGNGSCLLERYKMVRMI